MASNPQVITLMELNALCSSEKAVGLPTSFSQKLVCISLRKTLYKIGLISYLILS